MSDHSGFKPPDDDPVHDDVHDDAEGIRVVGPSNPMPHWTEPATGEMPRLLFDEEPAAPDEDLEAWSSFAATPRWRSSADDWDDDTDISEFGDSETRVGALDSGAQESSGVFVFDDTSEPPTDPAPTVTPIRTGTRSAPAPAPAPAAAAAGAAGAAAGKSTTARKQPAPTNRPGGGGPATPGGPSADRDLPVAMGVGVALAVVALVLFSIGPGAAMGLVTLVIAAAAAEFYAAMQKVAYRPATLLGIVACAGMSLPIQVAVMGCVVNGPGEARSADIGIAAGRQRGHLFIKGEVVRVVPESAMVDELVRLAEVYVKEGPEAALAQADPTAAAEAEKDRAALLDDRGDDANSSEERVELIRKRVR